jgi:NAD(P)-dependent dehydrogenase (short-subunit alcohol dehydrogenase family)
MTSVTTLKNQIAVITGASGGIGGAIASALAQHEAILWVLPGQNEARQCSGALAYCFAKC